MRGLLPLREMERAVRDRDSSFDGLFLVAVQTTGVFCRPSCPARPALTRNRQYFATAREAVAAGYRPCKRCRPLDANGRPPEWVVRLLTAVEREPEARLRDADLRARAVDPARVRRYFRKHYGMTFHTYCRRRRMGEALQQIQRGAALDDVILGHGYGSHSGFREAFARTFGRSPGRSRTADCVVTSWLESPLGPLLVASTANGICMVEFSDPRTLETQRAMLHKWFECAILPGNHEYLERLDDELARYFAGTLTEFSVPLVYPGTPFQQAVWDELRCIPYGETRSYEELARAIGAPAAQRAVGQANGLNRISIIIPCHRVVNKDGRLGGYGGGLWRKQLLLDLERRVKAGLQE